MKYRILLALSVSFLCMFSAFAWNEGEETGGSTISDAIYKHPWQFVIVLVVLAIFGASQGGKKK